MAYKILELPLTLLSQFPIALLTDQWFLTRDDFAPQETFVSIRRKFCLSLIGRGVLLLTSSKQDWGCCLASYSVQDSPAQQSIIWPNMLIALRLKNFATDLYT